MPEPSKSEIDQTDVISLPLPSVAPLAYTNGAIATNVPAVVRTPETVLDNDPGDDTTRRFRYQWTYGAILSLAMLVAENEIKYIYCEHHDDILIAYNDGTYGAVQVKTRLEGRDPFKTLEEQIKHTLQRFVKLELDFKDQFCHYTIVSNCGFWTQTETKDNLEYVCSLVDDCVEKGIPFSKNRTLKPLVTAIKTIKKDAVKGLNADDITDDVVQSVFQKLRLQKDMPSFSDAELRLSRHLANHPELNKLSETSTWDELTNLAREITNFIGQASSKECEPAYKDYVAILRNPQGAAERAVIEGKRIDKASITKIIERKRVPSGLLQFADTSDAPQISRGLNRLEQKMNAGGISVSNIEFAKNLQNEADFYGLELLNIQGNERGLQRWNHMKTLVRARCLEAHDRVEDEDEKYGKKMLIEVRDRLRELHNEEKNSLPGCRHEHLLGIAYLLTQECKIWWSKPFDVEGR